MVRVIWWHFFGSAVGVRTIPPLREIERYIYMLLWGSWKRSEMGTTWFIVAAVCGGFFGRSSCTFTVGTVSTVDYCTILPSYWSTCGVCTSINSSWLCLCGPTFFFLFLSKKNRILKVAIHYIHLYWRSCIMIVICCWMRCSADMSDALCFRYNKL